MAACQILHQQQDINAQSNNRETVNPPSIIPLLMSPLSGPFEESFNNILKHLANTDTHTHILANIHTFIYIYKSLFFFCRLLNTMLLVLYPVTDCILIKTFLKKALSNSHSILTHIMGTAFLFHKCCW